MGETPKLHFGFAGILSQVVQDLLALERERRFTRSNMFRKIRPMQRWILLLLLSAIGAGSLSGCIVDPGHHDDHHDMHDDHPDHDHDWR
jgi:hypothetical protein